MRPKACALLALALVVTGCAASRPKGGLLVPFAAEDVSVPVEADRRFALVIGIDRYDDERFHALRFAAHDARAVGAALTPAFKSVKVLATPETTDRASILEGLRQAGEQASRQTDTLVVYLSGHGTLAQRSGAGLERVLVARDTRLDLALSTGIPVDDLLADLERIPARRKLLVLATCHSGRGKSALSDPLARALATVKGPPPLAARSEATIVLTAAAFGEAAREDDQLEHDVYTHFLLEALTRADRDRDGAVTASEAHDWARDRTYVFTQGAQRPTTEADILGTDPVILAGERVRTGLPVLNSYDRSADGLAIELDGRPKGVLPGGIAVEPGEHALRLLDAATGHEVYAGSLRVVGTSPIALSDLLPQPIEQAFSLEGSSLVALAQRTRAAFIPVLGGGGLSYSLRFGVRHLWWVRLGLQSGAGRGEAPGIETRVPFTMEALAASLQLGQERPLTEALRVRYGIGIGWLQLWRQLRLDGYSADQASGAPTLGLRVGLEWRVLPPLSLGLEVEVSGAWMALGAGQTVHPLLTPSAHASWSY